MESGSFQLNQDILFREMSTFKKSWRGSSREYSSMFITIDSWIDALNSDEVWTFNIEGKEFKTNVKDYYQEKLDNISSTINKELDEIRAKIGEFFYDKENILVSIFSQESVDDKDLYPFPLYISSTNDQDDQFGIMVYGNGRYESFEENEEASDQTYAMVNKILGLSGKIQKVFSAHNEDLVKKIKDEGKLPANLYVSPKQNVAAGYWSSEEQRVLFSCDVNMDDIRMESDIDWRTKAEAPITNYKFLRNL